MIIYRTLSMLFDLIEIMILIRVVSSYIPKLRETKFYDTINILTEPILFPIRKLLNNIGLSMGSIDFSPIFALLLIGVLKNILFRII